jgi:hypothetical protein
MGIAVILDDTDSLGDRIAREARPHFIQVSHPIDEVFTSNDITQDDTYARSGRGFVQTAANAFTGLGLLFAPEFIMCYF